MMNRRVCIKINCSVLLFEVLGLSFSIFVALINAPLGLAYSTLIRLSKKKNPIIKTTLIRKLNLTLFQKVLVAYFANTLISIHHDFG